MFISDNYVDLSISHSSISMIKVDCADLHDVQRANCVLAHVEDGKGVLGTRKHSWEDGVT